jgi:hypothetical protein
MHHQQELQLMLDTETIDVCLVSETHFTNQSFARCWGYKVYHIVHPDSTATGGGAVLIQEHTSHYGEGKYKTEKIQATAVTVNTKNHLVTLTAVHCPPKLSIKKIQYIEFLQQQDKRSIAGGDFNAKNTHWGSRLTTAKGRELLEAAKEYGCEFLSTGTPTYGQLASKEHQT